MTMDENTATVLVVAVIFAYLGFRLWLDRRDSE